MTVKPAKESRDPISCPDFYKSAEIPVSRSAMEIGHLQRFTDTRRSDEKTIDRRSSSFVHYQVLKIREEDSHLGKDIGEGLSTREKLTFLKLSSQMDALFYSRPILPSSPLGNKTAIESFQ